MFAAGLLSSLGETVEHSLASTLLLWKLFTVVAVATFE